MAEIERKKYILCILVIIVLIGCIGPVAAVGWSWTIENVDLSCNGIQSSIALDWSGYPHISYYDNSMHDLKYAWKNSSDSWFSERVDSQGFVGEFSSLKLSPVNNVPMISYYDETNNKLKYAWKNPVTGLWNTYTILDDSGRYTSLTVDVNGRPHISYYFDPDEALKYVYWDDDGWYYQIVDAGGVGWDSSIALDKSGHPAFSYRDFSNGHLKYAGTVCTPPSPPFPGLCLLKPETVDSSVYGGLYTSLAFDSSGHPLISYLDNNLNLKYAMKDAGGWHITVVDNIGQFGYGTDIALDSSGNPAISYQNGDTLDLKFAWMDSGSWQTMTVDHSGFVGSDSSLVFDSDGNAHISYLDFSHGILKYAKGTRISSGTGTCDLNSNGRLDFNDVVLLFNRI